MFSTRLALLAQDAPEDMKVQLVVYLIVAILSIAGLWAVFSKAGKPGWAAIIPIYNAFVLAEICGKSALWGILLFVPCVNVIAMLVLSFDLAKRFGKGAGFGLGIFFLGFIFIPILGFGSATYLPPATQPA